MGAIYEVRCLDGLGWYDVCTEFHEDQFSHSKIVRGAHTTGNKISLTYVIFYNKWGKNE
jgi:hypothetical protein